jgi:hypothetical protein
MRNRNTGGTARAFVTMRAPSGDMLRISQARSWRLDTQIRPGSGPRKQMLVLSAAAVAFAFGLLSPIAQAQGPAVRTPGSQQSNQDGGGMIGQGGMMGGEGMGREGMMERGMMGRPRAGGMAPMMMRMIFSLMDARDSSPAVGSNRAIESNLRDSSDDLVQFRLSTGARTG